MGLRNLVFNFITEGGGVVRVKIKRKGRNGFWNMDITGDTRWCGLIF